MPFDSATAHTDTAAGPHADETQAITGQKQASTQFQQGVSGNPAGRPPGTLNRRTRMRAQMLAEMLAPHLERAVNVLLVKMEAGNGWAVREILRHFQGPKGTVQLDLPEINSPADLGTVIDALLEAVAAGQLPPKDAAILTRVVLDRARVVFGFQPRAAMAARRRQAESQAAQAVGAASAARRAA